MREPLAGLSTKTLIRSCADLAEPDTSGADSAHLAAVYMLRLLARRIQQLTTEARDLERCIRDAVAAHSPQLLERVGIGPDCAAALLVAAGDNPERLRTEASFAALCGVSPVEASSGKTQRRRLNRGGDRQTNAALYRIVLSRLRWDQRTRDYLERRLTEGKTRREAIRCIKRYVAREIHNLTHPPASPPIADLPEAA
ncbi:transposase [Nonomuraea angiospora]|uniref:transposase n=1 Tax=Nonomuraea angiospora TaxID=46172 RepID=UPI0029AFEC94|nr:transposase [Nonomuraea angiospora]MDX3111191.1 transposase [Nonomuraea angiospora]